MAPQVHLLWGMQPSHSLLLSGVTIFALLCSPSAQAAGPQYCAALPVEASIVDASQSETDQSDGSTSWTSTVIYTLSTGETAEAVLTFDSRRTGVAYFTVDGKVVVYATVVESAQPTDIAAPGTALERGWATRTWTDPSLDDKPDLVAELLQESVGDILIDGLIPQPIKCSAFGKGVMQGLKYLWIGATAAAGAACCAGTGIIGCAACSAGAAAAGTAGAEAANGHCN